MVRLCQSILTGSGYVPYYMYRQKYMAASFANIGYALPGSVSAYNIEMMEERQSVLAAGPGGATKFLCRDGHTLERCICRKMSMHMCRRWLRKWPSAAVCVLSYTEKRMFKWQLLHREARRISCRNRRQSGSCWKPRSARSARSMVSAKSARLCLKVLNYFTRHRGNDRRCHQGNVYL